MKQTKDHTLQSQVLYAPFVKAVDKVRKDAADMSFQDF